VLSAAPVALADGPPTNTDTVTWTNDCSGDLDPAACERLTYIAIHTGNTNDAFNNVHDDLFVLIGAVVGAALIGPMMRILSGRSA